ncbi:YybH family protein [Sutcliffiella cohnii]|uniref:YybH family protein n=1 Tax=Sutcliffiella cohnii TaxID=33932 RepID=UPI002E1C46D5|nr:nuclear transport factor 2 family protein [Sutcliffiella cohnii]
MSYKQALKQYIEATNTHDFNNVKAHLHDHAVFWFTNKTCTSMTEIQQYFENAWDTIKEEVYTAKDVTWIATSESLATCLYTYHYEGYHNGKFVAGSGRATNVFVNCNGEWKLIHEHLSRGVK